MRKLSEDDINIIPDPSARMGAQLLSDAGLDLFEPEPIQTNYRGRYGERVRNAITPDLVLGDGKNIRFVSFLEREDGLQTRRENALLHGIQKAGLGDQFVQINKSKIESLISTPFGLPLLEKIIETFRL